MSESLSVSGWECNLERGTIVTKLFPRRRPEIRKLILRRETGQVRIDWIRCERVPSSPDLPSIPCLSQVLWLPIQSADKPESRNTFEGSLEIRDIHEVRPGKNSKDFDKLVDDNKRAESCFVVLYGQEFKLRTLSVVAFSPQERNMWITGLRDMCAMVRTTSYPNAVERWLRKEFYAMENSHNAITQKDLKSFLSKLNCKISTSKLVGNRQNNAQQPTCHLAHFLSLPPALSLISSRWKYSPRWT